jgi:hypothetical protein
MADLNFFEKRLFFFLTLTLLEGFILSGEGGRAMREQLHIGEVARLVGVSTKTIRYYHQIGLLAEPERTESGYRLYDAAHLLRLQHIRRLRALGLRGLSGPHRVRTLCH